jgi:hypothetical protein
MTECGLSQVFGVMIDRDVVDNGASRLEIVDGRPDFDKRSLVLPLLLAAF